MTCGGCGALLDSRATFCPVCGGAAVDPMIGQVIANRYEVERRIAIGGFGSIYRGYQHDLARPVALKIMHRELAADPNLVARFRREGEVLTKLRDPHTVATYEMGETPEHLPFIAMELLDGESALRLFHLHGRMAWPRVLGFARGACSALGEAHALGIVHRDLKPGNLFITRDDAVKVLDFGIAKIMSNSELGNPQELTVMGTAVGTVEYMAPEQLMGGKADGRTDIYTLGVVAYELITGRRPFNAAGLDLLTVQLTETPPPASTLADVPPEVDQLLLCCLAQDPAERFSDVHALARAIDDVLARSRARLEAPPPVAAPVSAPAAEPPSARPPARRPRTEAARPSLALLVLAAILFATGLGLAIAYFA